MLNSNIKLHNALNVQKQILTTEVLDLDNPLYLEI